MEVARDYWSTLDDGIKGAFLARFEEITVTEGQGRRVFAGKAYYDGPIGFAKIVHPSPGWRAMYFRDGNDRYVSNWTDKGDQNHNRDKAIAMKAREEHFIRKEKGK